MKNPSSLAGRAARALPAAGRVALTGTPIERYGDEVAAATLQRLTGPFVLRRLKTDRSIITTTRS